MVTSLKDLKQLSTGGLAGPYGVHLQIGPPCVTTSLPGAGWKGVWPCPWSHTHPRSHTHWWMGGVLTGTDVFQPRSQSKKLAMRWCADFNECSRSWCVASWKHVLWDVQCSLLMSHTDHCLPQLDFPPPSIIFRGILTFFVLKFLLIVVWLVWAPGRDCLTNPWCWHGWPGPRAHRLGSEPSSLRYKFTCWVRWKGWGRPDGQKRGSAVTSRQFQILLHLADLYRVPAVDCQCGCGMIPDWE